MMDEAKMIAVTGRIGRALEAEKISEGDVLDVLGTLAAMVFHGMSVAGNRPTCGDLAQWANQIHAAVHAASHELGKAEMAASVHNDVAGCIEGVGHA